MDEEVLAQINDDGEQHFSIETWFKTNFRALVKRIVFVTMYILNIFLVRKPHWSAKNHNIFKQIFSIIFFLRVQAIIMGEFFTYSALYFYLDLESPISFYGTAYTSIREH